MKFYAAEERSDKSARIYHFPVKKDRDEWIKDDKANRRLLTRPEYDKILWRIKHNDN